MTVRPVGFSIAASGGFVAVGVAVAEGRATVVAAALGAVALIGAAFVRPREFTLWAIPIAALVPAFVRVPSLGGPALTPQRAILLLCAAAVLVAVPTTRRLPTNLMLWFTLFAAYVMGAAILHGAHQQEVNRALAYTLESFLPLFLAFRVIRSRDDVHRLLQRLIVVLGVASGLAIWEAASGRYLFAAHSVFFHAPERNGLLRVQGVFPHPLVLGVAIVLVLPLALNELLRGHRRQLNLACSAAMVAALVLTQGRGPIFAAVIAAVVLVAVQRGSRRGGLLALLGVAVMALAFSPWGAGGISRSLENPTSGNGGFTIAYRQQLLHQSISYANAHPFGAGAGNSAAIPLISQLNGHTSYLSASIDNAYAKYALELGWPGLGLFLMVLLLILRETRRLARRDELGSGLYAAQVGMLVVSLTVATFTWAQIVLIFWALAGAVFALVSVHAEAAASPEGETVGSGALEGAG